MQQQQQQLESVKAPKDRSSMNMSTISTDNPNPSQPTNPSPSALFHAALTNPSTQQTYLTAHNQLLTSETSQSWDAPARQRASALARRAAAIIQRIREDERDQHFGSRASESMPGADALDMGGQFLINKSRIESSRLWAIARRLPKGCHLHLHFNAAMGPGVLLERARGVEMMCIRSTRPLVRVEDYALAELVFGVRPRETPTVDVFDEGYRPEWREPGSTPWMRWSRFREGFVRQEFHRREGIDAEEWLRRKMVISEREAYGMDQTVNGIWARFNQATRCFKGLLNYESAYRWYIGAVIDDMIQDRVMYAELRPMLMDKSIPSDDGTRQLSNDEQMEIILQVLAEKKRELEGRGELDRFPFGLKLIYCTPRSIPKQKMREEMEDCIRMKIKYPDLICGFDLVGAEDRPNSLHFYHSELLAFQATCDALALNIPFLFHAGETLLDTGGSGTRDPNQSNLYDACLLRTKRIGHGYALTKHPTLLRRCRDQRICVELCPISNELLHLCRCVKEHVYPALLAAGVPCTVNADNPSLFRGNDDDRNPHALAHEFYQVMVGTPAMTLHGWRQLVDWSVEHSCLPAPAQRRARDILDVEWEGFCEWVVRTYGPHAETLDVDVDVLVPGDV